MERFTGTDSETFRDNPMNLDYVRYVPDTIDKPNILYKYRELNKNTLGALLCNQVYFSRPEDFNDPYEPEKIFEESAFGKMLDRNVKESGILCLCRESTSLSMWSYYAAALKGFAIGYNMRELLKSTADGEWKEVYKVDYDCQEIVAIQTSQIIQSNYDAIDPEKIKMFATKASIFSHEDEYRVVINAEPDFKYSGYGLYSHSPEAISEIIFGELIPENDEKSIRAALKGREITFKRATRVKNKFKIEVVSD